MSPDNFTAQMQWLKDNKYNVISMDDMIAGLNGQKKLPSNPVTITFDDGNDNNYSAAYPILKQFGYTATFFIITGRVGQPGTMTWAQLKDLAANGMTIGSHTVNHVNLKKANSEVAPRELTDSKAILEKNLGFPVKYFSYPNGGYTDEIANQVQIAGYAAAVTTHRSPMQKVNTIDDNYVLSRIEMNASLSIFTKRLQSLD